MATAHISRKPTKPRPPSPSTPEPQPAAEAAPPARGLLSDWIATLIWIGAVAIMATMVFFDTLAGLFQAL
jgi:hypothetical protein